MISSPVARAVVDGSEVRKSQEWNRKGICMRRKAANQRRASVRPAPQTPTVGHTLDIVDATDSKLLRSFYFANINTNQPPPIYETTTSSTSRPPCHHQIHILALLPYASCNMDHPRPPTRVDFAARKAKHPHGTLYRAEHCLPIPCRSFHPHTHGLSDR